jgi:hypothetical protein
MHGTLSYRTGYILNKTPIRKKLKAEQPLSDICHHKVAPIVAHSPLCISTISQKPHNIVVLYPHQTTNFLVEFSFLRCQPRRLAFWQRPIDHFREFPAVKITQFCSQNWTYIYFFFLKSSTAMKMGSLRVTHLVDNPKPTTANVSIRREIICDCL